VGNSSEPSISIVGEHRHEYSVWGFSGVDLTNGFSSHTEGSFAGSTFSDSHRSLPPLGFVPATMPFVAPGVSPSPGVGSSSFSVAPRAKAITADGKTALGASVVDRWAEASAREPSPLSFAERWSVERIGAEPRARVLLDTVPANQLEMPLWFSLLDSPLPPSQSSRAIKERVAPAERDVATVELSRELGEDTSLMSPSVAVVGDVWDLRVYTGSRGSETAAESPSEEANEWRFAGLGTNRAWLADTGTWGKWLSSVTSLVYALLQLSFRPRVSTERFEWQPPRRRPGPSRRPN
jgi:hypothetical protein